MKKVCVAYSSITGRERDDNPMRQDVISLLDKMRYSQSKPWWKRVGWPAGALGCAILAFIALLINLAILFWTLKAFKLTHGIAQVFSGNCLQTEKINTWLHLGINAVSTMLLSSSNYCMQILSAPTRKDIDKAHARKKWLDIGIPSVRNLTNVAIKKTVLWWLLALSSIPLHLMYNSVFFSTIATNDYNIIFANDAFVQGGPQGSYNETQYPGLKEIQTQAKSWEFLSKTDCINSYATEFLNTRRDLVAVIVDSTSTINDSVKGVLPFEFEYDQSRPSAFSAYGWICDASDGASRYGFPTDITSHRCSDLISMVKSHSDRWQSHGWQIEYCLSERVDAKCSLNFSLPIIVVVMICNVGKALIMLFIAFRIKDRPLITIGDAIDSFLNMNDPATEGMCLISKGFFKVGDPEYDMAVQRGIIDRHAPASGSGRIQNLSRKWMFDPIEYMSRTTRWSYATSSPRWAACMMLHFCCMMTVAGLLIWGITNANSNNGLGLSAKGIMDLGIGAVHPVTLIGGWNLPTVGGTTAIASILIANTPQPILSFLYLLFNGVFTSMLAAAEWSAFAHERKSLRVSNPKPGQRSTYFLQLPFRYAVPLMIISGILHWSISQSIFFAQIASFGRDGNVKKLGALSTCGYSPMAIIITLLMGIFLAVFLITLGRRHYKPGIPIAGSCSAAIAAACHGRSDVDTTAPLMWGVISEHGQQIGHCTFSDQTVEIPQEGALYAGYKKRD
jgi:hypothetical protein